MNRLLPILFVLPVLAIAAGEEQTSRYYFDHGAERYVGDDVEKARAWVNEGLVLYPGDERLLALKQLLDTPPQSGGGGESEQQPEDQPPAGPSQPEKPDEPGDQKKEPAQQQSQQTDATDQEPAQMTEEEAKQVLDAMREREQQERARAAADRIRREAGLLPPVEKDW